MWLLVDGALLLSLTMGCELLLYMRRREHSRDAARLRRIAGLLLRDASLPHSPLAGVARRLGRSAEAGRS